MSATLAAIPVQLPTPAQTAETPAQPAPTLLEARNISVFYGQHEAIKKVSIDVGRNEVVALIGPSGCGKSTFLRSINRINDLIPGCRVTGEMTIGGQDVYDPAVDLVKLRRQVGMVFQRPNPFPQSIYDNLTFGPKLQGITKRAALDHLVEESLRGAAIWDEVKDRLHVSAMSLSGGQQQRICIARTLANKPSVILMDEPCSALDPIATAKVEDLIIQLKKLVTVVIVTHNMHQAARISDRTAFFYTGELIEYDQTSKMFTNPSNPKTEQYVTGRFG